MKINKYKILLAVAPITVILDQLTKLLINIYLPRGDSIGIIAGILEIVHIRNRGAAFGILSGAAESLRIPFFYVASVLAITVLIIYFVKLKEEGSGPYISLSLIMGGAVGNVIDRVFRGEVIDFISVHWYDKWARWEVLGHSIGFKLEWPSFNVADSAITVAVIWLVIFLVTAKNKSL